MGILSRLEAYGEWLRADPWGFALYMVCTALCILLALVLHEVSHGYVAYRCGDPTAKMMGRLTLNPAAHLDPLGTLCMVALGFGWAKPVPVNPRNFRNYRRDDFFVSIAGITTNFLLFLISITLATFVNQWLWLPTVVEVNGGAREFLSINGAFTGMMTTGMSRQFAELMAHPWLLYVQQFLLTFAQLNLCLAVFNLLPLPPLDGFHIVNDLLLKGRLMLNQRVFQICQGALLVLCLTGLLGRGLSAVVGFVDGGIISAILWLTGAA